MSRLDEALQQIKFARQYTTELLEQTDHADWFRMPTEGVTHIAWQVGHLALAEYFLLLDRIRGRKAEDADLISDQFRALFTRLSEPIRDQSKYPKPAEIRAIFDRVHQQALAELAHVPDDVLDQPVDRPHRVFTTKLGALIWFPQHELLHTGQIALLRRMFGAKPMW
jgi:uncharacterized damage-inducible protein DinB